MMENKYNCNLYSINQIAEIILGGTPKRSVSQYWGGNIKWATAQDIASCNTRYIYDTKEKITEYGIKNSSAKLLNKDTVIISARGTVGALALLSEPMAFNQTCYGLICDDRVDPSYLYFALKAHIDQIKTQTYGAVFDTITKENFKNIYIPVPLKEVQKKIVTVLSDYDDLIENNIQRITILEKMTQLLYNEWFVNFKFPGYEKVPLIDSQLGKIPYGWEVTNLGKYLETIESGSRPKGGAGNQGVPSIGAENIIGIGKHKYQEEKYVPKDFYEKMKKGKVKDRDVALYKDGKYIGRSTYFRDGFPHKEFCVNEHVFLLRSDGMNLTQNILYLWLKEPSTIFTIRATDSNAAQPGINQNSVKELKLVIPPKEIADQFDKIVDPFFSYITNLAKKNNVLRQIRDLLLPKFISGKIDVSKMDL